MMTEDLSVFFDQAVFAVPAVWNGQTTSVMLDSPTEDILGGRGQSNEYRIMLPTSDFAAIRRGDVVTIEGVEYTVRESPDLLTDGKIKSVKLTRN